LLFSNAHYVGYVEDGESVERLQAEFAAAAVVSSPATGSDHGVVSGDDPMTIDAATAAAIAASEEGVYKGGDFLPTNAESKESSEGLTQEQLEEVFRRTSAFTVRAAVRLTHEDPDLIDELELWRAEMDGDDAVFDEEE
jgi:hypothetical protein